MRLLYRLSQLILRGASYVLPWRVPKPIEYQDLSTILQPGTHVLVVTDATLMSLGLVRPLLETLREASCIAHTFDKTASNPTIGNVEEAYGLFCENNCAAIVAFGGGAPMDCAKGVGARAARPRKTIGQMKGLLRVLRTKVPVIAVPTTAGTGSETTLAAVITNEHTHEKYVLTDTCLIPQYALFDPAVLCNLPRHITAGTGMDALTHAVEAYIGRANTAQTREDALRAVALIHESLLASYRNGSDLTHRTAMQNASYYAGRAFTRAYVGNVHAIAHALGGYYNLPHGQTNATLLPLVLRAYHRGVDVQLAELGRHIGMTGTSDSAVAEQFITWIEWLNAQMGIPTTIPEICDSHIPLLAKRACKEANPFYPVPIIWNRNDFECALYQAKEEEYATYPENRPYTA